mmetsp:Transcript_86929/g.177534  ORF Transcript_86929/g.177534 Transcript_86929/m.177534 type:complete len:215 (+) Transcript_86929:135-779(+)
MNLEGHLKVSLLIPVLEASQFYTSQLGCRLHHRNSKSHGGQGPVTQTQDLHILQLLHRHRCIVAEISIKLLCHGLGHAEDSIGRIFCHLVGHQPLEPGSLRFGWKGWHRIQGDAATKVVVWFHRLSGRGQWDIQCLRSSALDQHQGRCEVGAVQGAKRGLRAGCPQHGPWAAATHRRASILGPCAVVGTHGAVFFRTLIPVGWRKWLSWSLVET